MIDLKLFNTAHSDESSKNFLEDYKLCLKNRGFQSELVDEILALNKKRKKTVNEFEMQRAKQKKIGESVARLKREKKEPLIELKEMSKLSEEVKELSLLVNESTEKLNEALSHLPNMCHSSVPVGKSEDDNQCVRTWGDLPSFDFKPKDHIEIGESLNILDFQRAAKVTGARFAFLIGLAARLERSLLQFMMDVHSNEHGYTEIIPPYLVNSKSLYGTSQFPKFKEDVFGISGTDYFLIPTAEVPVTNIYANETLDESLLPQSFVASSPCFRSEAGSYGKDTKGLVRQHQFEKVELLKFTRPEDSYKELESLVGHAEKILQKLNLPYRVVTLCTGDIGFGASKCYDLEVWLPAQKKYREISSCSNFECFQARRANIRFKSKNSKPRFVHTLNGSGLAIGRTLIAILENYQNADGSVTVPDVLRPYMGVDILS